MSRGCQDTLLDVTGVPTVNTISNFLLNNPTTSAAIDGLAQDQLTATYTGALKALADTIGPLEKDLLVRKPLLHMPAVV